MHRYRVELISDVERLEPYRAAWRQLAAARGNPFISPEWFDAMLGESRPRVAVALDGSEAVQGVLPFVESRWRRVRALRFAGADFGDRFHPASALEHEPEVWHALLVALARSGSPRGIVLDGCPVEDLAGYAPVEDHISARVVPVSRSLLPYIDLKGLDWNGFMATLGKKTRQEIGRRERKLRREHGLKMRSTQSPEELEEDFITLFRLHDARREGLAPSTIDPQARANLLKFCRASLENGWLRLHIIECDDAPVAAFLGWSLGGVYSAYQGGFDPSWSRRGLGILALAFAVRHAIEEGAAEFDLLRGDQAHKLAFSTGTREAITGILAPPISPLGLLGAAERTARKARQAINHRLARR